MAMKYKNWNSTPSGFRQNKQIMAVGCFFAGLIVLAIAIYVLATEIRFINSATKFDATIAEVRHEYVAAGRGSVLAYVPVVEIPNVKDKISVDTFNKENTYATGTTMSVLCDLSISRRCIRNTFFDKWWGVVDFIFALLFLVPSLLYLRRSKEESEQAPTLTVPTA